MFDINKNSGFIHKRLIIIIFVIVGFYSSLWLGISYFSVKTLNDLNGTKNSSIANFEFVDVQVSGFPFSVSLNVTGTKITVTSSTGYTNLNIPKLVVKINPLNPADINLESVASANFSVAYDDFSADYNLREITGEIGEISLLAGLSLTEQQLSDIDLSIDTLVLKNPLTDDFKLINVHISAEFPYGLSRELDNISIEKLMLDANFGRLSMLCTGSVNIDKELSIEAHTDFRITGFMAFAEALRESHLYTDFEVVRLKEILTLLTNEKTTEAQVINVPINIEHGIVYLGQFPVSRL